MAENATGLWTIASGLVPVVNNDETFTEFYNNIDWTNEFNSSLWSTPSLEIQTSSHHKFQESGRRDYEWCRARRKVSALKK